MRIYLLGFMGSGKSSQGKKLASKLGYKFLDTDQMTEKASNAKSVKSFAIRASRGFAIWKRMCCAQRYSIPMQ